MTAPLADRVPSPLERRVAAAQATLDRFKDHPFAWGKFDCVRLASYHLRQMGYRPKVPPTGYKSLRSAKAALVKAGFDTLAQALDAMGLERIAPAASLVGDIVQWPSENDLIGALGVQLGNGRTVAYHPAAPGAVALQLEQWVAAWRVHPK